MTGSTNLLIIMSDEHNPKMLGCAGHPIVQTPNLDVLAANGTTFDAAYCNSPVCIPARATFATGRFIHDIEFWDNAQPYDGSVPSWHHAARAAGHRADSIGKLHFRSSEDDNGFSNSQIPMHVVEELGDLMGLIREDLPVRGGAWKMAGMAGPGESMYSTYDRDITARAQIWLHKEAPKLKKPWVLLVSLVCPHFPLTAPPEYFFKYFNHPDLPMPKLYGKSERPDHPYLEDYRNSFNYDDYFDNEEKLRTGIAAYMALCSFLDEQVGKLLRALDATGLCHNTRVLYTSDHGDNVGARGMWGKSNMFEEVARVPTILAGPDIPAAYNNRTPITHVDVYPTVIECLGIEPPESASALPGKNLIEIANAKINRDRIAFSEYHGMGSTTGAFMIRKGQFKYVHYADYQPQLFNLAKDPEELNDVADDPAFSAIRQSLEEELRTYCDPNEVDKQAKKSQSDLLKKHGGRDAVIARGDLGFSVPPGHAPQFD